MGMSYPALKAGLLVRAHGRRTSNQPSRQGEQVPVCQADWQAATMCTHKCIYQPTLPPIRLNSMAQRLELSSISGRGACTNPSARPYTTPTDTG